MSSSISSSGNLLSNGTNQSTDQAQAATPAQPPTIQQQVAEASLTGIYGPPYILDASLAYAIGNIPLSGSPPATPPATTTAATDSQAVNVTA